MTDSEMIESNRRLRASVEARLAAARAGAPVDGWYESRGFAPAEAATDGDEMPVAPPAAEVPAGPKYLPGTMEFLRILDEMRALHLSKTHDYGDSSSGDALANIRNGAEMVGISHWKGALVRAADKMQRLKTYCRVGRLVHEGVEDTLLDLAAYAALALVLFREEAGKLP